MQEEENGDVVSEQGCVSEKEVKKGEKMKIVGMTGMKTRKELVKRRAPKCICKQRKPATQKKSGMRRGVLLIQEAAFTKRKEGEDEEKSSESVNTSSVVRENRECKDKKNMKENGESDVEDGPGSSKRTRRKNYLFTGEQEETRKMENEIYSKDDNPNSYKRNGDRSKENSGLSREKREEGGEVEDVGSCERREKDTNKDLEMNIQGTGAERNKDALSGEGRDDRSDEKKNEGEGRNMEIKEYVNKVIKKENGDVWMAVLKENRDKQEENKVRKGQRLCGEEEDYKTRMKENEFGRKISEAEEGKEGTKETKADECEMITDKSKEEYEEHADNEILEENKDKDPNVCNDVRGDEDKEECKENAEKDILEGNMDKVCNVQSDVRGNDGKEEYQEHADMDTREKNLGKEPDVQSDVTGDESKEKNKREEAKMTHEEENNKLVSLKTSFETDGLNKDKKDEDERTAVKGSGEETYSNLSEKQGELAEQVKMAEIEVKGEGQSSETHMSLLESAKNRHQPSTWSDMPPGTEVALVELNKGSQEYKSVISKVESSFIDRYGPQKVVRVQNPYLWGCYLLRKAECIVRSSHPVTEKVLFHATGQSNIDSITKDNLDWRLVCRGKYGCGVSFSPFAIYANTWCNRRIGSRRALVIARVLVGRSSGGNYSTVLPDEGYDTTKGNYGQVYVKYCDHEFYPAYVMYYSNE